ncbi:OmpA family protein [Borreliella valaisiana]|uniref:Outer membrane protein n=1 Tax=Borreliella valaisiana VS116 TaxID=445987 RepID=D6RX12_BORVA|nr:OmpA family protein [Borreliella valaisiana]AIJ29537.1 membrane protein [Borreliella valaisiana Tom4006]EEF81870.1 outer membrane protein [Borreliella valaisiana VS116]WKC77469.1 OmpA family protein [Borreliella valaisiana]WLN24985.1 OmpA family protein [Borreliella valaisiana]WVN14550.1 OmpA family protein [Borreliella valaisiana]
MGTKAAMPLLLLFLVQNLALSSEMFAFKYIKGAKFRLEGTDNQEIHFNGHYNSNSTTNIQISSEIKDTQENFAKIKAFFRILKRENINEPYLLNEEFEETFSVNKQGEYIIGANQKRPSVRGIPRFPKTPIKINEKWTYPAEEYIEASKIDRSIKDFVVKFNVNYEYKGKEEHNGKHYHIIFSNYESQYNIKNISFYQKVNQKIYFDNEIGNTYKYNDEYTFEITQNNNQHFKMIGNSFGRVVSIELPNDNFIETEVEHYLQEKQIKSINVEKNNKGINLSFDIEFYPDSFQILQKEYKKLDIIAELLEKFKKNNLLIEGHTEHFGLEEEMHELSEKRARAIGNYLIKMRVKNKDQILFKGWGSKKPKYPKSSPLKAKNRRVEITILNN